MKPISPILINVQGQFGCRCIDRNEGHATKRYDVYLFRPCPLHHHHLPPRLTVSCHLVVVHSVCYVKQLVVVDFCKRCRQWRTKILIFFANSTIFANALSTHGYSSIPFTLNRSTSSVSVWHTDRSDVLFYY